jgi:hypothetical protein
MGEGGFSKLGVNLVRRTGAEEQTTVGKIFLVIWHPNRQAAGKAYSCRVG